MGKRNYTVFSIIWLMVITGLSLTVLAQDSETVELVPITADNAEQLVAWIPAGLDGLPSQDWIPNTRGSLLTMRYSAENNLLFAGATTGLYLFDADNLQSNPVFIPDFNDSIDYLRFSPDETQLIVQSTTHPGHPGIYNVAEGQFFYLEDNTDLQLYDELQFSDDGTTIYGTAYSREQFYIVSWDAESGERLSSDEIPELSQYFVDFRPYQPDIMLFITDDSYMTARKRERGFSNTATIVQRWDKDTFEETQRMTLSQEATTFYYLQAYNLFVTSSYQNSYDGALIWDATTGQQLTTVSTTGRIRVAPDENSLWFYNDETGSIRVWDVETRQFSLNYTMESAHYLSDFTSNRLFTEIDGAMVSWQISDDAITMLDSVSPFAVTSRNVMFTDNGNSLIVTRMYTGIETWNTESWTRSAFIPVEEYIRDATLSPDNLSIATAVDDWDYDERLRIYDLASGSELLSVNYANSFQSVAYHPTENYLAVGRSRAFDLALYSTQNGAMLASYSEGGVPYSVAFSPDGTLLASGNADGNVRVYNTVNRGVAYVIEAGSDVNSLAFSHDGTILAVGTRFLNFYDATNGQEIHSSDYLDSDIYDMAFSPDDSLLATIRDGSFALWNVASGDLLWENSAGRIYGHLAFHPDGTMIATSAYNLSLWVVNTGEDSDDDGIDDVLDACPMTAGDINGCPDTDSDGVVDSVDGCPDEAGTARGCPDDDNDGVGNPDDMCPDEIGSPAADGCPDDDNDGIVDSDDMCPAVAGVEQFSGCPDTDADNIADADDACPVYAGTLDNNGCPGTGHTNANANVRTSPSTNGAIVRSIPSSETFYIIGKNSAGDWLQIVLDPDGEATIAWIYQSLVVTDVDLSGLPIQE